MTIKELCKALGLKFEQDTESGKWFLVHKGTYKGVRNGRSLTGFDTEQELIDFVIEAYQTILVKEQGK